MSGNHKRAAVTVSGIGDRDLGNPEVAKALQTLLQLSKRNSVLAKTE